MNTCLASFTALMFQHEENQLHTSESDSEIDVQSYLLGDSPPTRAPSTFQQDWPYVSTVKGELNAVAYDVNDLGERFSTGRVKLEIVFYGATPSGLQVELSRHVGMRLRSRTGINYLVCQREPKPTANLFFATNPPNIQTVPQLPAIITLIPPRPILSCTGCGAQNSQTFALLACTTCRGNEFTWSCACTAAVPAEKQSEPAAPSKTEVAELKADPTPARRPQRNVQAQKKWTEQIKYVGPLRRGILFHKMGCTTAANYNCKCGIRECLQDEGCTML